MAEPTDVLVCGAGPVGLLVALQCARFGLRVRVVERASSLPSDLRASSFHPPTLDMLDEIGVTPGLLKQGLICDAWQVRLHPSGDRVVFPVGVVADACRHPFRLQCEQRHLSEILLRDLRGFASAEISFDTVLTGFVQDPDGVAAIVETPRGSERLRARILVGSDGARSTVRQGLGLPFEGETYPETTLVITTPFPFEDHLDGLSLVTSCWTEGGNVAFLRLPGLWRLAVAVDDWAEAQALATAEAVEALLRPLAPTVASVPISKAWPYRVQQRIAPRYRAGRVALAGDAAHVNSPAGGLGLNAGLHDAFELARALVAILRDGAPLERLDLYDRRRRPVAAEHILGQAARNRGRMREREPERRRALLAELQAVAADPERLRAYVMRASMIEGLRAAALVQ